MEVDADNVLHISADHKAEKEEGEKVSSYHLRAPVGYHTGSAAACRECAEHQSGE